MVTDERTDTERSRALEARFFDLSIDLLCFLDFSGYFKRLNPAWEAALTTPVESGWKSDER